MNYFEQGFKFEQFQYSKSKPRCGCYAINQELLLAYPNQSILVPIKFIEYDIKIINGLADIRLIQSYENPTDKFLEVEYNFPVNSKACVYSFIATFGSTRLQGRVKEKQQAKKQYKEAVEQGKRAAMGQIDENSKDILKLKIGNIDPRGTVKIEIAYFQQLELVLNSFLRFHLPVTISPRYLSHLPQAILESSLGKESIKSEGKFYWNFKVNIQTMRKLIFFDSHSHNLKLVSQNESLTETLIVMEKQCLTSKDFVLTFATEDFQMPSYVLGGNDFSSTVALSFIPKFCSLNLDDAYRASVQNTPYETDIDTAKGEYIFLLDRSGSMGGVRMEKAKQALILFIKSLPADTYFNIVSFGSGHTNLFNTSVKYSDKEIDYACSNVKSMSADMGGTEIYYPLKQILERKPIDGYPKQVFLLTDGGVSDTEGVIKLVGRSTKYSRVHTIGIGNGASESLITGCAEKGKGYSVFIDDSENPSAKIIQLLTDSLSPVISKVGLFFDKSIVESIVPNPESIPYILKNEIVNFYITFKGKLKLPTTIHFGYQDSCNKLPYSSNIEVDPKHQCGSFVDKIAQFKKIRLLEQSHNSGSSVQQSMYYVKVVDKKAEAIRLSVQHQVLSEFTAFICVQTQLIDGKYEEVKGKGQIKVQVQPVLPPEMLFEDESSVPQIFSMARMAPMAPMAPMASKASHAPKIQKKSKLLSREEKLCSLELKSYDMEKKSMNFLSSSKAQEKTKSGGFINSITNFFGGIFSSQNDSIKSSMPIQAKMQSRNEILYETCKLEDLQQNEAQDEIKQKMSISKDRSFKSELKKMQVKSQKNSISNKTIGINQIISQQAAEGSWKDLELIEALFSKDTVELVKNHAQRIALITYLIAKWIEKHHPQKEYSLVIKKALNFVKKTVTTYANYSLNYDHLIV